MGNDVKERVLGGGVSIRVENGNLLVFVNPAVLAASKDLTVVGSIQIASIDIAKLEADTAAEGGRFWRRVKGWFGKK